MSDAANLKAKWIDRHLEPKQKPDPAYPLGIDVDMTVAGERSARSCTTALPYPAKRIGYYVIECSRCGIRVVVTTAGRPDDPRSVKVPCMETRQ